MFARRFPATIRHANSTNHAIVPRRAIVVVATTLVSLLGACGRDVTAPGVARTPTAASASPSFSISGDDARTATAWNGRKVFIRNWQDNGTAHGLCLDIPGSNAFSGQDVNRYACQFGILATNQQFVVQIESWLPTSTPGFSIPVAIIKSVLNPSLCLDMRGGTAYGGEHLQVYTCHSGANQRFALPIASPFGSGHPVAGTICTKVSNFSQVLDVPLPLSSAMYVQQYAKYSDPAGTHHWNQVWSFWDVAKRDYVQAATLPGSGDWIGMVLC
jgi:hypothetical protein